MPKRDQDKRENLLMDFENKSMLPVYSPIPESPLASPIPKKVCSSSQEETVSNADILNAIKELSSRFSSLEKNINKNSRHCGHQRKCRRAGSPCEVDHRQGADSGGSPNKRWRKTSWPTYSRLEFVKVSKHCGPFFSKR